MDQSEAVLRGVVKVISFSQPLWRNRRLIQRLTIREIQGRYRGTALGMSWSVIQPLLMLAVYTFVFSGILKSKWGDNGIADNWTYALNLFAGLITFNLFAECITRGPVLVTSVPNYIKKVVFPVEILPAVSLCNALYHALTGLAILLIFRQAVGIPASATIFLLPVVWLPLAAICLGLGWILSALGVYLRDLPQATGLCVNILLFTSAVFYPISALPERWGQILGLNPLLVLIEKSRDVLLHNSAPSLKWLSFSIALSICFCEVCFRIFQKARKGFADVI